NFSVTPVAPGSGTPTGTVTVSDGNISCTAPVAVGSCQLTFLVQGPKALTATYTTGDANFTGGASLAVSQTVDRAGVFLQWPPKVQQDQRGVAGFDTAHAVAFDSVGNAVVVGMTTGATTGKDFTVAKLAQADGHILWQKVLNGAGNGDDEAFAVT